MSDTDEQEYDPIVPVDTEYEVGQDNVEVLGMDIHNPVFAASAGLTLLFSALVLLFPEASNATLMGVKGWILDTFDAFFSLSISYFIILIVLIGASRLGKIRLGGEEATPEFGFISWVCMLFAAGVGIGMTFYGAAEPLAYYTGVYGTPLGVTPETKEAYEIAFSATLFHWGFGAWSVYALMGLSIAFFSFNWKLPLTVRSIFYPLLGERVWGWPGHLIDLIAVVATLFGLATSLGIGANQTSAGLSFLFGFEKSLSLQAIIIAVITLLAIISVIRGLDRGVRILSNINIAMAALLFGFVVFAGPTIDILSSFGPNLINYFRDLIPLSAFQNRPDREWFHGWTIFYWAWWVSWSPFVGMFIARISRGRTIREFLVVVMSAPLIIALVWFTAFGETAIFQYKNGIGSLPDGITDFSLVLFQVLENLVIPIVSSIFALMVLVIFFITSFDSGALVIDNITSGGKIHDLTMQRVFWAIVEGVLATVLLVGGGNAALSALQAGAISTALPFTFIMLFASVSLLRGLYLEAFHLRELNRD